MVYCELGFELFEGFQCYFDNDQQVGVVELEGGDVGCFLYELWQDGQDYQEDGFLQVQVFVDVVQEVCCWVIGVYIGNKFVCFVQLFGNVFRIELYVVVQVGEFENQ